ncbi:MAG: polyprenyl synthetase family protein [Prevotellaceae bacterium]|jgi:geranylgeranyl pyrophosphate synthase|nr:polyprenyl synthetase family protein [Prevotellaceae bacterium]
MDKLEKKIFAVPQTFNIRMRLRSAIDEFVENSSLAPPLSLDNLSDIAMQIIDSQQLSVEMKGWLMVEINNRFQRATVAAIPYEKRMLLLPQCLRNSLKCSAEVDELGLLCRGCKMCLIPNFENIAEELGMMSMVAEGFTTVINLINSGIISTVIGVGCLESLEKVFPLMIRNAVPGIAVPLNHDGCKDTDVDYQYVIEILKMRAEIFSEYIDYNEIKETVNRWFQSKSLNDILHSQDPATLIARKWLLGEGKRWRPYLVAAVYRTVSEKVELTEDVRLAAFAVECFHKASLVHDDIQDNDLMRYGQQTVYAAHGVPIAINTGDLLIGEGYRLLSQCKNSMALIAVASEAHIALCKGQGLELDRRRRNIKLSENELIELYRLKTVPAFETALVFGLICSQSNMELLPIMHDYADALGIAYQLQDDLEDLEKIDNSETVQLFTTLIDTYRLKALATLSTCRNSELKRLLFLLADKIINQSNTPMT